MRKKNKKINAYKCFKDLKNFEIKNIDRNEIKKKTINKNYQKFVTENNLSKKNYISALNPHLGKSLDFKRKKEGSFSNSNTSSSNSSNDSFNKEKNKLSVEKKKSEKNEPKRKKTSSNLENILSIKNSNKNI